MSLIKCPECGYEISDRSTVCIHCGYPISENMNNTCKINGKEYDFSNVINLVNTGKYQDAFLEIRKICKLSIKNSLNLIKYIDEHSNIFSEYVPIEYNKKDEQEAYSELLSMKDNKLKKASSPLTCPKCGSTAVATGAMGYSFMTGFLGSGRTVNRCGNCGYKWKP